MPLPKYSKEEEARDEKRKSLHEVMEIAAKFFEATLAGRGRRQGARLSRRPQPRCGDAIEIPAGLCAGRAVRVEGASGRTGRQRRGHGGNRPSDRRGRHSGALRPLPRPGDVSDHDFAAGSSPSAAARCRRTRRRNISIRRETPLFHKGSNLYNGAIARQAVHDGASLIVVEGYVDVIAMVTAGYPAAVAPLGTALTEDQLGLLWKMADEPILCFDGDKAGRRAAYRAVDMAMPRLKPGKSLRFAMLPDGQDPDDLYRSGGKEAIAEVLSRAQPLGEMLWTRETEAASFDTPERRAAFEARVHEVVRSIGDESVRKYYAQDFSARLRQLLNPQPVQGRGERSRGPGQHGGPFGGNVRSGNFRDFSRGRDNFRGPGRPNVREATSQPSSRLSASPIVRGFRTALPPREALILVTVVNHPWLLEHHAEDFSELEFLNPDTDHLRRAVMDAATGSHAADPEALRAAIAARGLTGVLDRVEAAITHTSDWPARPGASIDDVAQWWTHVVTLHRKQRTLNRELKDAERALGEEPTDTNFGLAS